MLKLISLSLHNFMNISEAFIDFSKPVTLLSGNNGSGKSSIVEAIALCFLERKRSDAFKDYIKYGEIEATIDLTAYIDKDVITFNVKLTSNATEKNVVYKNTKYHNSEISGLLDSLGFNYYGDLLFSMQGSADIATLSPTQRLNYLKNLLNFDYSQTIEKIEESLDIAKSNQQKTTNEIEFLEKSIESRKLEIKKLKVLPYTEDEIKLFNNSINEYNKQLEEYNLSIKTIQENNNKITSLQNQIYSINNSIKSLEIENSSLKEKLDSQQKYKTLLETSNSELSTVQKEIIELSQCINDYILKVDNAKNDKQLLDNKVLDVTTRINKIDNRIESLNNESTAIRGDTVELIDLFHSLSDQNNVYKSLIIDASAKEKSLDLAKNGICPTCGNIFTDKHKEQLEQELNEINAKIDISNTKLIEIKSNCKDVLNKFKTEQLNIKNEIDKEQTLLKESLVKLENELIILREKKAQYESKRISLETCIKEQENNIIDISEVDNNIKKNCLNIENFNNEVGSLLKEIETLKTSNIEAKEPDKADFEKAEQCLSAQKQIEDENKLILSTNDAAEKFLLQAQKNIEDNKNLLIDIDNNIDVYKNAKQIFEKNLPNFLVIKTCSKIQSTMNSFIQSVFPNIEVRLFHSKKGVEFYYTTYASILKEEEKTKENMLNIKMASGFEKAILTTAFKEALCKAYCLPFCILDEVDAAASEENSERLFNSIVCGGFFKQSIIITHKPVVRDIIKQLADTNSYNVCNGEFNLD